MRITSSMHSARKMAQDIVDLARDLGADAQILDSHLLQRGWSAAQIRAFGRTASGLAARILSQHERAAS